MTQHAHPLNGHRTIKEWLAHPVGGPILRDIFSKAGVDDATLNQMGSLPLGGLPEVSHGRFPQALVDQIIREANGGNVPQEEPPLGATGSRFAGKVAVITGGASGIGHATVKRIVSEGGTVVAVDVSEERLAKVVSEAPVGKVIPVVADITDDDGVERIVSAAGPRIDCLANVAGIMDGMVPLHEVDNALWDRVMAVNVTGTFKVSRAVLPIMLEQEEGSIVNVASQAALRGNAAGTAYGTSKHAIVGTATAIEGSFKSEFAEKRMAPFLGLIPPITTADTQAAAIAWLLSGDAANINGVILPTDGGWSVQ